MSFNREQSRAVLLISGRGWSAGFRDRRSGIFRAVCPISTPIDVNEFMDGYKRKPQRENAFRTAVKRGRCFALCAARQERLLEQSGVGSVDSVF